MSGPSVFTPFLWVTIGTMLYWTAMVADIQRDWLTLLVAWLGFVASVIMIRRTAEYWENR